MFKRYSKSKIAVLMLVLVLVMGTVFAVVYATGEPDTTPPTIAKTLTPNGDGTYNLSLSVTDRSSSSTESNKADVIVVFDRSGSMNYDQHGHDPDDWFHYSGPSRLRL